MHLHRRRRSPVRSTRTERPTLRPRVEPLELRRLLSTGTTPSLSGVVVAPAIHAAAPADFSTPTAPALTPSQVRTAYGFDQITLANGAPGDGSGTTIAIVDAYHDPNIQADLNAFDARYGLPATTVTVVGQDGQAPPTATDAGWAAETALDVEWAHAMAPGARILLVEANSSGLDDLMAAVDTAAQGANVVSMSWGTGEFAAETSYDSHFNVPNVTFVAASGDSGSVSWPAASPNVVAVGGTSLAVTPSGAWSGETAWADSGGGVSAYEPVPSYQVGTNPNVTLTGRGTPDVVYNADPSHGFPVYDSFQTGGRPWMLVGGTSAGAPQWAALIAIADQGRAASPSPNAPLGSADTQSLVLYGTASTVDPSGASSLYFHDVKGVGGDPGQAAGARYNLTTGLGSPIANNLVSLAWGRPAVRAVAAPVSAFIASQGPIGPAAAPAPVTAPAGVVVTVVAVAVSTPGGTVLVPTLVFTVTPLPALTVSTAPPPLSTSATAAAGVAPARPVQPTDHASTLNLGDFDLAPADRTANLLPVPEPAYLPGEELPPLPEPPLRAVPRAPEAPAVPAPVVPDAPAPAAPAVPADDALEALIFDSLAPRQPARSRPSGDPVPVETPATRVEAAAAAGATLAVWGAWQLRSRLDARRRRSIGFWLNR